MDSNKYNEQLKELKKLYNRNPDIVNKILNGILVEDLNEEAINIRRIMLKDKYNTFYFILFLVSLFSITYSLLFPLGIFLLATGIELYHTDFDKEKKLGVIFFIIGITVTFITFCLFNFPTKELLFDWLEIYIFIMLFSLMFFIIGTYNLFIKEFNINKKIDLDKTRYHGVIIISLNILFLFLFRIFILIIMKI